MAVSNPHTQGCTLSHTVRAFAGRPHRSCSCAWDRQSEPITRGQRLGIELPEGFVPKQPFWFLLTWISILWYGFLVFYVGWNGFWDIRRMIRGLKRGREQD